MIKKLLAADPQYLDTLKQYTLKDTVIALIFYVFIMVIYYVMGVIMATKGIYLGIPVNLLLILIPVLICRRDLVSLGINKRNLKRSLIVASIIGMIFLLSFSIIPNIMSQSKLQPFGNILYNIFYYFVIIAFAEEISFRAFIQPRLYPLCKQEWLMIIIGGLLFVFMHYPFQMAVRQMSFAQYWPYFIANAPMQFIWHLAFSQLYRRYGNIFAGTVLHGFVDMSMGIFQ